MKNIVLQILLFSILSSCQSEDDKYLKTNNYEVSPSSLIKAIRDKNDKAFKIILSQGVDPNTRNSTGATPLLLTLLESNDVQSMLLLNEAGIKVDYAVVIKDMHWSPLHYAAKTAFFDAKMLPVLKLLLSKVKDVNILATYIGSKKNVLVNVLEQPSAKNLNERTAEIVKLLVDSGANPFTDTVNREASFVSYVTHKDTNTELLISMLKSRHFENSFKTKKGMSVLPLLVVWGKLDEKLVDFLISKNFLQDEHLGCSTLDLLELQQKTSNKIQPILIDKLVKAGLVDRNAKRCNESLR
ncbi:ankyrin repeat domain-containing protein [Bacteriovoracaceae bacterium]|nr:ankyrin repeat domain-containing protein [Bacteriovoracaceae bacterium]